MSNKIIVLGSGESGVGAALLAKKMGFDVFVSDNNTVDDIAADLLKTEEIQWESNKHSISKMKNARWIVKSPGIPTHAPIIQKLKAQGLIVISEIEFASRFTDAIIIAITGSNGKTTTTLMVYEILKNAGFRVGLAGNIGDSFSKQIVKENFDYYVLEISSFQLDDIIDFRPDYAVVTNITPDHLDRYQNRFEAYTDAKMRITENQSKNDYFIFNADDATLREATENQNIHAQQFSFALEQPNAATHLAGDCIQLNNSNKNIMIDTTSFALKGRHNLLNAMAASTIANLLEISKETIRDSLLNFKGAPHRMENVLTIQKVTYINDSKATNVNATYFALESICSPLIWIVGGVDKGNDYNALMPLVREKVKGIICIGVNNEKLVHAFGAVVEDIFETTAMDEAVKIAHKLATKQDTVLLSPACASFDLFENYEDRGNQFKSAIRNL